jgi:hypothetical protein
MCFSPFAVEEKLGLFIESPVAILIDSTPTD